VRLISGLKKLEAGAARARERKPEAVGLIWSRHEVEVDPETLEGGQYIAVDVHMLAGAPVEPGAELGGATLEPGAWSMKERATYDAQDLGVVYDAGGLRVGRVVALEGSMIEIDLDQDELSPAD
jgi:hypothetical protein